jgi:hypothetical protein
MVLCIWAGVIDIRMSVFTYAELVLYVLKCKLAIG